MKKIYALFMTLCLIISATAAPLVGTAKKSYPLYQPEVVKAELAPSMHKAPAATQGLQYDAEAGELIRYYNETDQIAIDADYLAQGNLYVDIMAGDYSDYLSLLLFVQDTVEGAIIPEGTYPITSTPAYNTALASQGYSATQGVIPCAYYPLIEQAGQLYISTPMYFMQSGNVVVEHVNGTPKITINAVNSNNVPMTIVFEVGGKSEKVEVKAPLKYDATEADGALDYTYGEDAMAAAADKGFYGTFDVADATSMLALLFVYPEGVADAETTIPAGTYTISDSQEPGTVLASSGVSSTGSVGYSFFAKTNEQGQLVPPLYFPVSGTVEVTKVNGKLKVEVNGLNSNNVPVHVVYDATEPVVEEPEVEKPEPTYTENNLNPYAFGLESKLSDDKTTLTVTYRLNNSNATSVNVVIYNGEDIVASIPGTTTIGKNTVEVATGNLPAGVELKWAVEVNGTSVEAPTQETKMYSMYCPHGLAIDKDPESEYFGRILVADAMNIVKDKAGYLGSGIGAGLHAFNPSFTTDSTVYTGGNDFTRILATNGYQPWRVKISEDGRIFVSSLDLNGVVVWEVSKDLQTWTPVIAGTNDATDHNIYDADGNFVAGLNCSMDVTGKGEDLKLLLYSTNNKGIAFNQSGYRLDEYALGTATTWTGTPKNILEGGKLGLVHTNVEFIYDGEGGYWFGASRAGNAGQPNLVHINAAGEQDYYTEDASLYGGDGVLVHNGMLFKGKARTSGTVGNFGVWTIGKDADGKVTLTEKWTVVANGIGRNLNEFAVDYAENLYVVGNSGEKIIAYALPYSGQVETPAAAKYAFQLPEPLKLAGIVKRAVQNGDEVIVLTHEADGTAHIYQVVDGKAVAEVSLEGVVPVDPENKGSYLAISDIAVTEDGKLVANNYVRNQFAGTTPEAGYKLGTSYYYIWNDLAGAPAVWFTSQTTARSSHGDVGVTFALKGTSTNAQLLVTAVHNNNRAVRLAKYNIIDGQYVEPNIPGGQQSSEYYEYFGTHTKEAYYQEAVQGKQFQLNVSPLGEGRWIMDGELVNPSEFVLPAVGENYEASATLTEDLGKKYNGATYVTVDNAALMVAPFANPDGELVGVEILNITNGLDNPAYVDMLYVDEAVAVEAAATAVEVVEGGLNITLVADATIHTWFLELNKEPEYQVYEDEITNLVIDLDNLVLIGGPSSAFQVDVFLGLGEYNRNDDTYQLLPESSIAVMGSDATFIDGYAYEVDAFTPSAKAVVHCEWNGMLLEFHLTMTAEPMEATKVVVENATVEIEKYVIFGDVYDYALKMSGEWINPEDGLTYPVLVEVPVYYPEATEPSEIMSTVTVGGWGDNDPWLGFGEGTLTVITETTSAGKLITATGIVQNPMAGVAIDITISGSILHTNVEDATVTVKPVKMIQNGQLIIKKGDAQFNAQGATVK